MAAVSAKTLNNVTLILGFGNLNIKPLLIGGGLNPVPLLWESKR